MSQDSLSLFDESPAIGMLSARTPKGDGSHAEQQRHLLAARRLARRIAQLPDHSPEQVQVGRMICRHLVAMLKEAQAPSTQAH